MDNRKKIRTRQIPLGDPIMAKGLNCWKEGDEVFIMVFPGTKYKVISMKVVIE